MHIPLGNRASYDFTTVAPDTGANTDTDIGFPPYYFVFDRDSNTPTISGYAKKIPSYTGLYNVTFDVLTASGFVFQRSYNVVAEARVSGIYGKATIATFLTISGIPTLERQNDIYNEVSPNLYYADINFVKDNTASQDEYTVSWFKNNQLVTNGGVSNTFLNSYKRSDGTLLINNQSMTQIGTLPVFKYDATGVSRQANGEAVYVVVSGTIDGAYRTWGALVGRDN